MQAQTKPKRLPEIDTAKGLAIVLVVIGHVVARQPPLDNEWYNILKGVIYLFHMPFFMFLSGFVMAYTYKPLARVGNYLDYLQGKFLRLIPAFLILAILILAGKVAASHIIHVDNMNENFLQGLVDIFIYPAKSSASSLWYIYVLFIFYVFFPIITRLLDKPIALLLVSFAIYFTNPYLSDLFMINRVAEYLPFIVIGAIISKNYDVFLEQLEKYGLFILFLFITSIFFREYLLYPKLILGLLSIPALLYLVRLPLLIHSALLQLFGKYVFVIYLFNTIVIGVVKGVGLKFLPWDGLNFLLYFPLLTISGILLPICFKRLILVRSKLLDKLTN